MKHDKLVAWKQVSVATWTADDLWYPKIPIYRYKIYREMAVSFTLHWGTELIPSAKVYRSTTFPSLEDAQWRALAHMFVRIFEIADSRHVCPIERDRAHKLIHRIFLASGPAVDRFIARSGELQRDDQPVHHHLERRPENVKAAMSRTATKRCAERLSAARGGAT